MSGVRQPSLENGLCYQKNGKTNKKTPQPFLFLPIVAFALERDVQAFPPLNVSLSSWGSIRRMYIPGWIMSGWGDCTRRAAHYVLAKKMLPLHNWSLLSTRRQWILGEETEVQAEMHRQAHLKGNSECAMLKGRLGIYNQEVPYDLELGSYSQGTQRSASLLRANLFCALIIEACNRLLPNASVLKYQQLLLLPAQGDTDWHCYCCQHRVRMRLTECDWHCYRICPRALSSPGSNIGPGVQSLGNNH